VVDGDVLSDLDEGLREEVIAFLPPEQLAEAVRELDSDDVVDLIEDLDLPQQEAVLDALSDADRAAVEKAMTYPEYSAGRLMQREVVMAPEHWTVGEAIDHLRAKEDLPEQFYHIVLVDPRMRPVGQVALGKLMAARRPVRLRDIAEEDFRTIPSPRTRATWPTCSTSTT
jgi:magnesium transporter